MEWYLAWCWLGSVLVAPMLAARKGIPGIHGFLYALALGPFGVAIIGLMPTERRPEDESQPEIFIPTSAEKKSPDLTRSRALKAPADPAPDDFDAGSFFGGKR